MFDFAYIWLFWLLTTQNICSGDWEKSCAQSLEGCQLSLCRTLPLIIFFCWTYQQRRFPQLLEMQIHCHQLQRLHQYLANVFPLQSLSTLVFPSCLKSLGWWIWTNTSVNVSLKIHSINKDSLISHMSVLNTAKSIAQEWTNC